MMPCTCGLTACRCYRSPLPVDLEKPVMCHSCGAVTGYEVMYEKNMTPYKCPVCEGGGQCQCAKSLGHTCHGCNGKGWIVV